MSADKKELRRIGKIGNYYGNLLVATDDNGYYWAIEDWNGIEWNKIPQTLYATLIAYEENRETST